MKIFFDLDFLGVISRLGSSISISKFKIAVNPVRASIISPLTEEFSASNPFPNLSSSNKSLYVTSDYVDLASIWNLETETLDLTINVSDLNETELSQIRKQSQPFVIEVYYNQLGSSILKPAFYIYNTENLVFKNLNIICCGNNYISIKFPSSRLANVIGVPNDKEAKFLESESVALGESIFNITSPTSLILKGSYQKYVLEQVSNGNNQPSYLNKDGKKIMDTDRYFKYYKKIRIRAKNLSGTLTPKTDNYTYFITGRANTINIVGTLTYDYYKISNGEYILLMADQTEDLSADVVIKKEEGSDEEGVFSISQADKTITYGESSTSEVTSISFYPSKFFKDELSLKKYIEIADINKITFIRYSSWLTWANTNFSQEYQSLSGSVLYPLFMLDDKKSSEAAKGIYSLSISKKVDQSVLASIRDSFHIASDEADWKKYFSFDLVYNEADSSEVNGYRYNIILTPNQDNTESSYYPLVSGSSKLILCWFVLGSTTIYFYVIQRPKPSPLILKSQYFIDYTTTQIPELSNELCYSLSLPGTVGPKSVSFYVSDNLKSSKYGSWNYRESSQYYISEQLSSGVYKQSGDGKLTYIYRTGQTSSLGSISTTTAPSNLSGKVNKTTFLGYVSLARQKTDGSGYDPNDWVDAMYCDKKNDVKIALYLGADTSFNQYCFIQSTTPYFYNNKRLYIFRWGKEIKTLQEDGSYLTTYSADDPQVFYFGTRLSIEGGHVKITSNDKWIVSITADNKGTYDGHDYCYYRIELSPLFYNINDSWVGGNNSTEPDGIEPVQVSFTYNNSEGSTTTYTEIFYCIISGKIPPIEVYTDGEKEAREITLENGEEYIEIEEGSSVPVSELSSGQVVKLGDIYYKIFSTNYRKVTGADYLYNGLLEYSGKPHKRNYYICSPINNTDSYIYWVIAGGYNPKGLNLSKLSGELNNSPTQIQDSIYYEFSEEPKKLVATSLVADGNDLILFNSIWLSRYSTALESPELGGLVEDWKFSLYKDGGAADGSLSLGIRPINTGEIIVTDDYIEDRSIDELSLTYIGLYRIVVKSDVRCRVVLSDFSSNVKFFDESTNAIMTDTLQRDVDPFESGAPVYFVFTGGESDAFKTEQMLDKVFNTTITITQIDHPTVTKTLFIRRYYNKIEVQNSEIKITGTRLSSAIEKRSANISDFVTGDKNDLFLFQDSERNSKIVVYSTIETYVNINVSGLSYKTSHDFDINYYAINRGYMGTTVSLICSFDQVSDYYPLPVFDTLTLSHPSKFDQDILGDSVKYLIYCVKYRPSIYSSNKDGMNISNQVVVSWSNQVTTSAYVGSVPPIIAESASYVSDVTNESLPQYLNIIHGNGITVSPSIDSYKLYKLNITPASDNPFEKTKYVSDIDLTAYIKASQFILSTSGDIRNDYTQSDVDALLGTSQLKLSIYQGTHTDIIEEPGSVVVPGAPDYRPISAYGEQRTFLLSEAVSKVVHDEDSGVNDIVPFKIPEKGDPDSYIADNNICLRYFNLTFRNPTKYNYSDGYDFSPKSDIFINIWEWNKVLPDNFVASTKSGKSISSKTEDQSLTQMKYTHVLILGYNEKYYAPDDVNRSGMIYKAFLGTGEDNIAISERDYSTTNSERVMSPSAPCRKLGNVVRVIRKLKYNTERVFLASASIPEAVIDSEGNIDMSKSYMFKEVSTEMAVIRYNHTYCNSKRITVNYTGNLNEDCDGSKVNYNLYYVTAGTIYDEIFYITDRYGNKCVFWVEQKWPNNDDTYDA